MKKNRKITTYCIAAFLLVFAISGSVLLSFFKVTIDKFFLGQGAEFSEYDDSSARIVCEDIEREAQVLLKNDNDLLPLKTNATTKSKVALFGMGAYDMRFAGAGSGGGNADGADTFYDALTKKNVELCPEVSSLYAKFKKSDSSTGGFGDVGKEIGSVEVAVKNITKEVIAAAKKFTDTAFYVVTRVGGEGSTLTDKLLSLTKNEEETLDLIVENFDKVLVILNTSNPLELGFVDGKGVSRNTSESFSKYEGKIDACLWIGLPGYTGANAVADVICGVSPSGRLADTYAYDVNAAPSVSSVGNAENIYVGYRWFETAAYEGAIDYEQYERTSTPAYTSLTVAEGVQYPFGYGLSYTKFSKEIVLSESSLLPSGVGEANKNEVVKIAVKVTNVGDVGGMEVVQAYYTPPYTSGGIEKSYVTLADFAKTKTLAPNESQTVVLQFPVSDMKSFDYNDKNGNGFCGYELEKGDYLIRILNNAHDWVNVTEDSSLSVTLKVNTDLRYEEDDATGNPVSVKFAPYADSRKYLSRANGFANLSANIEKNEKEVRYDGDVIENEKNDFVKGVDYAVERKKVITFTEMLGVAYNDKKWDEFVSQLTKTEMAELIAMGNFQTAAVERLGIPKTLLFDGPAAIKDTYHSDKGCLLYPAECSVGATWSKDVTYKFGCSAGDDAVQCGVTGWYAPGVNLHLNAFTARGFEYFSECPVLSGKLAASESKGAESKGLLVIVKHLVDGLQSAVNEQALREVYAKPFEIAIKEADAHGLMTSYTMLGTWVGQVKELLNGIIRGEWGFTGFVTSDAASPSMQVKPGIRAGNDIWLATDNGRFTTLVREEKNIEAMKTACKNVLYTVSLSPITTAANVTESGFSPSVLIMIIVDALSLLGIGACVFVIVKDFKKKN